MESTWVFKPKYDVATCNKLVGRFADRFLNWHEQGIDWNIREVRAGWFELRSIVSEPSMMEYWTDTCVHDTENTNVYCPMGASCWVQPADGIPKHVDMLEALLTLQIA